jgi:hypothetical protein
MCGVDGREWKLRGGVAYAAYGGDDGDFGEAVERSMGMARGAHELAKVSVEPAMPDPSTPCGCTTSETALRPFQGWPAHRASGLRSTSTPLDTPSRAPMWKRVVRQRVGEDW